MSSNKDMAKKIRGFELNLIIFFYIPWFYNIIDEHFFKHSTLKKCVNSFLLTSGNFYIISLTKITKEINLKVIAKELELVFE